MPDTNGGGEKTIVEIRTAALSCSRCGKQVSSLFWPVPTDTPDKGLIVRAWIECPECIEATQAEQAQFEAWLEKWEPSLAVTLKRVRERALHDITKAKQELK